MTRSASSRHVRFAVMLATVGATSLAPALPAVATAGGTVSHAVRQAPTSKVLFDDFDYAGAHDPSLARHGWTVRTDPGGPGVDGATWSAAGISFPRVDRQKVLRLTMTTDGTAAGTTESEFSRSKAESRTGTYQARIRFTDRPSRGRDGDHLVESFFAISAESGDCDPTYSETDFSEYLPNGGYGSSDPVNSQTTWRSTGPDCDRSKETDEARSLNGWHTVTGTVACGRVRYYVDGRLVADHPRAYYPRRSMAIDFNLWLIDLTGHQGTGTSRWHEDIDYVYYAQGQVLGTNQVTARVRSLRQHEISYRDTL